MGQSDRRHRRRPGYRDQPKSAGRHRSRAL